MNILIKLLINTNNKYVIYNNLNTRLLINLLCYKFKIVY